MGNYGYVCFAYSKNEWIAKAIAKVTGSQWSHTFITVPAILNNEMAMEAGSGGTEMVLFNLGYRQNPNQQYEVYRVKVDQQIIDESIVKCLDNLEMPYGYLECPWFVWRAINSWFGRNIKSQNNWSTKNEVCAGLTSSYISNLSLGILLQGFGKNSINAQDLYLIVKAHPELFELIESRT